MKPGTLIAIGFGVVIVAGLGVTVYLAISRVDAVVDEVRRVNDTADEITAFAGRFEGAADALEGIL